MKADDAFLVLMAVNRRNNAHLVAFNDDTPSPSTTLPRLLLTLRSLHLFSGITA